MKSERRLTVEFRDDSRVDEYRIHGREVEFRARSVNGDPLPDVSGEWKQLTADDISLHLALDTVVGEWLTWRLLKRDRRLLESSPAVTRGHRTRGKPRILQNSGRADRSGGKRRAELLTPQQRSAITKKAAARWAKRKD